MNVHTAYTLYVCMYTYEHIIHTYTLLISAVLAQTALHIVCGRDSEFVPAAWATKTNWQRNGERKKVGEITVCSNRGHVINVTVLRLRSNNEASLKTEIDIISLYNCEAGRAKKLSTLISTCARVRESGVATG